MLIETGAYILSWPMTPAPFRPHLGEAIGLWARGRRQLGAWSEHLRRTRTVIKDRMSSLAPGGTVVVLGSGPLFDVPLEALAAHFDAVLLLDRAHLIGAQRQARGHRNVRLLWRDLSGALALDCLSEVGNLRWVISVNLLSQLAAGAPEGAERTAIDAHLEALAALPCPVTLITDLSFEKHDRSGHRIEQFDLLHGRSMPKPEATWSWEVAPFGEESRTTHRTHAVGAYPDWTGA